MGEQKMPVWSAWCKHRSCMHDGLECLGTYKSFTEASFELIRYRNRQSGNLKDIESLWIQEEEWYAVHGNDGKIRWMRNEDE